ncbi:MAG: beta-lactamase family protein [Planctomycetia bacterium]|nr:beta-lactamase family protein [Planctomycetia bacterium]
MDTTLPRTSELYEKGLAEGLHVGAQIHVRMAGEVVVDRAFGFSRPPTEATAAVPLTSDTLMLWLSAGKPVAAAAIMQLQERGLLHLDDPVITHVPEFDPQPDYVRGGKSDVTIRHLLTHTCGFRFIDIGDATTKFDGDAWNEIIRRLCRAPLERDWVPGQRAGYHPYTSWYILGEIIARLAGVSFAEYVRREIFLPLEMHDCWFGISAELQAGYGDRLGTLVNTERRTDGAPSLAPHPFDTPAGLTACAPGGSGHGPMRQLANFYEMLLGSGTRRGTQILTPASVQAMTARQRVGMLDETFKQVLDWGLGTIPNNRRYGVATAAYGYGRHASESTVGHSGSQSSVAFADVEHELIVALVLNGTCGEARHQRRIRPLLEALYEDLGITRAD